MRFVIWRAELMPTRWRSKYVGLQQKFQNLIRYSLASRYTGTQVYLSSRYLYLPSAVLDPRIGRIRG